LKGLFPIILISATTGIGIYLYQNGHIKLPTSGVNPSVATEAKNKCPNTQPQVLNLDGDPGGLIATPFNEKNERVLPAGTIPATGANVLVSFNQDTNTTTFQNATCVPLHVLIKLTEACTLPGTVTKQPVGLVSEGILNPGESGKSYCKWGLISR
jgi:hypothetical protein